MAPRRNPGGARDGVRAGSLSPRALARLLGVSESSVKRWVDAGRLAAMRTSGGHRRIALDAALRFVRESGALRGSPELAELAGLGGELETAADFDLEATADRLGELLERGREEEATRLLLAARLAGGRSVAALSDGPIRAALERIGRLWHGGIEGVFVEHRAVQIVLRLLERLDALTTVEPDAPTAVGGALEGDAGVVPTRMAATVLAAEGWRALDLGADTPAGALLEAVDRTGAALVWVSVGFATRPAAQRAALEVLLEGLARRDVPCALGGRELERVGIPAGARTVSGASMAELAALARALRAGARP